MLYGVSSLCCNNRNVHGCVLKITCTSFTAPGDLKNTLLILQPNFMCVINVCIHVHVPQPVLWDLTAVYMFLMKDEKEERKKEAMSNKQESKYMYVLYMF